MLRRMAVLILVLVSLMVVGVGHASAIDRPILEHVPRVSR